MDGFEYFAVDRGEVPRLLRSKDGAIEKGLRSGASAGLRGGGVVLFVQGLEEWFFLRRGLREVGEGGGGVTLENELVWGLARSLLMGSKPTATEFFT